MEIKTVVIFCRVECCTHYTEAGIPVKLHEVDGSANVSSKHIVFDLTESEIVTTYNLKSK